MTDILDHAARHHARQTVLSANLDGSVSTVTYAELHARSKALMLAVAELGLRCASLHTCAMQLPCSSHAARELG